TKSFLAHKFGQYQCRSKFGKFGGLKFETFGNNEPGLTSRHFLSDYEYAHQKQYRKPINGIGKSGKKVVIHKHNYKCGQERNRDPEQLTSVGSRHIEQISATFHLG